MRTDRHNNPTAITTDVARQAGLIEGQDFEQGDAFPESEGGNNFHTARLLGDPLETTQRVIDQIGFFTQDGRPRWATKGINWRALQGEWPNASPERKKEIIESIYAGEGGNGELLRDKAPVETPPVTQTVEPQVVETRRFDDVQEAALSGEPIPEDVLQNYLTNNPDLFSKENNKTIRKMNRLNQEREFLSDQLEKVELDKELGRERNSIRIAGEAFSRSLDDVRKRVGEIDSELSELGITADASDVLNRVIENLPISDLEKAQSYTNFAENIISDVQINEEVTLPDGEVVTPSVKEGLYLITDGDKKTRVDINGLVDFIGDNYAADAIRLFPPSLTNTTQVDSSQPPIHEKTQQFFNRQ